MGTIANDTHVTVNNPDDTNGTDLPIYEGPARDAATVLAPGYYLASATIGAEHRNGVLDVQETRGYFRLFLRESSVIIGVTDGEHIYHHACAMEERIAGVRVATLGDADASDAPSCDWCGDRLIRPSFTAGLSDTRAALLAATGTTGVVVGTGGNCLAFEVMLPDGRTAIRVTDADAGRPDGLAMVAVIYRDNEALGTVFADVHNPVALAGFVRSALAALPA